MRSEEGWNSLRRVALLLHFYASQASLRFVHLCDTCDVCAQGGNQKLPARARGGLITLPHPGLQRWISTFASMDPLLSSCAKLLILVTSAFLVYILALLIYIPLFVPLGVVVIATRANYAPKVVHLPDQTFEQTSPGSFWGLLFYKDDSVTNGTAENSTISMFHRIKRLEGWRGLYRSTILQALGLGVLLLVGLIFVIPLMLTIKDMNETKPLLFSVVIGSILALLEFPFTVLISRAIVHPVKLNWLNFKESLQKIMSETEYLQPWRLFTIPGAFLSVLLRWLLLVPATILIKSCLLSSGSLQQHALLLAKEGIPSDSDAMSRTISIIKFILYLGWAFILINITVPLDCISVRLMTQRTEKSYWEKTNSMEVQANDIEQMREKEPIVSLRPCFGEEHPGWNYFGFPYLEPYKGILDCAKKMRSEEGWNSLRHVALLSILECFMNLF